MAGLSYKDIAVPIPKPNQVCKITYYVLFISEEAAAKFLSDPTVTVAKVKTKGFAKVPGIRAVYLKPTERLSAHPLESCPEYVRLYIQERLEAVNLGPENIRVWADSPGQARIET